MCVVPVHRRVCPGKKGSGSITVGHPSVRTAHPARATHPRPRGFSTATVPLADSCLLPRPCSIRLPRPLPRFVFADELHTSDLCFGVELRVNELLFTQAASRWAYVDTMFHVSKMYVACVPSRCYKSRSDVAYVAMAIHVCYKCIFQMFQLFQTYVASVCSKCFSCFRRMLQVYVLNVSVVSDVCCKCFI
jgi:hypothetical protein